jgi:hypothetical protein
VQISDMVLWPAFGCHGCALVLPCPQGLSHISGSAFRRSRRHGSRLTSWEVQVPRAED